MMQAFEFGAGNEEIERNPLVAMWTTGRLFLLGSAPTVMPFLCTSDPFAGLWLAGVLVAWMLFAVGAYKSRMTKGVWWQEGAENFLFGVAGTGVSYGVGIAFQMTSGHTF